MNRCYSCRSSTVSWRVAAILLLACAAVAGNVTAPNSTNASGIDPATGKSCEPNCAQLVAQARAANEEMTKQLQLAEMTKGKMVKIEAERLKALSLSRSLDPDKYTIGGDGDHGGMTSSLLDPTKFMMVEPPTKCPHYDCAKMLVQYLQSSTERSCVARADRTQQFKRIGCSGFEIMDGDCDLVKCREIYNVKSCGDVTAYQCIRNAVLPKDGSPFQCKCEAYTPPSSRDSWKLLSPEEQARRLAEETARLARQKEESTKATQRRTAEEAAKKARQAELDTIEAARLASEKKAEMARLAALAAKAAKKAQLDRRAAELAADLAAKRAEENSKWKGLLDRNDKCCTGHVAINDGLSRIEKTIQKLDPTNGALLLLVQAQSHIVRTALAKDVLEPPQLTAKDRAEKLHKLFVERSRAGMLSPDDRGMLETVLKNKKNVDKGLQDQLTCAATAAK